MEIRKATIKDYVELQYLLFDCFPNTTNRIKLKLLFELTHQLLTKKFTVLIEENKIIGCFSIRKNVLANFAIHPSRQQQGLGNKMLLLAEKTIFNKGFDKVRLQADTIPASFYLKNDYKIESAILWKVV